ncbi:MAG TPA: hypothetical protein VGS57_06805 [Thermoanaerobaculia bacterium]|jgi:hypothetical protein|nr:hypothetical protein [Thermoanaerobaculia bacterium]
MREAKSLSAPRRHEPSPSSSSWWALSAAIAIALTLAACDGKEEAKKPAPHRGELETVDVAPPPDAKVDVERDVKERRRAESFAGVLPGNFPRGLPLPPHSSLVDQGRSSGGAWVELLVPRRLAAVRGPYLQQLAGAGWSASANGGDAWQLRHGSAAVQLSMRAQGPSTRLHVAY